jgi:hypothetical protein
VTTNCESALISDTRLEPVVRDMEKMNLSEKNLNPVQSRVLVEKAKAVAINDPLTRAFRHYPARVPYNVR